MTLLTVVFAAIFCTVLWYRMAPQDEMKVSVLCWIFWGASLMWLVDAVFAYMKQGAAYFTPAPAEMLNDWFLGVSVVALGLVVWLVILLVKDPRGAVKATLFKERKLNK
ncbi:MAG: hypothetical protein GXY67_13845 [Clostridiales bacterium]|nr:hypothetical protein [Clostridiales bacterium]